MRRPLAVAVIGALMVAACGTRVGPRQASAELRQDAKTAGGGRQLSNGDAAATGSVGEAPVAGGDQSAGLGVSGITTTTSAERAQAAGHAPTTTMAARAAAAGATATTVATGAALASNEVGVTPTEIRLGWVGTLTGPVPGLFRGALIGMQAFANYQNSQGGLSGRQLKVLSADDALDSGKNRAAHLELANKVFAFVGSFSINDDGGAAVINDCGCPDVTGNLSKPMNASPYHYGPQPAPPGFRAGPATWYAQHFPKEVLEHWALFVSQNAASEDIAKDVQRIYESKGFKVVYTRTVPPNDNNQAADVLQMQRAGVRSITFLGDLSSQAKLANTMQQQGFSVDLANWNNSVYDTSTFKVTSASALKNTYIDQVYAMFLGEDAGSVPEVKTFLDWMHRTDPGQIVDLFSLYGWLSGRLFADAMTKLTSANQPLSRKGLLDALSKIGTWDGHGLVAPVNIGERKPSDCFYIFTVTPDAKFKRIFPEDSRNYACDIGPFQPRT